MIIVVLAELRNILMKTLLGVMAILFAFGLNVMCPSDCLAQGSNATANKKRNVHRRAARSVSALVASGGGMLLSKDYVSAGISEKSGLNGQTNLSVRPKKKAKNAVMDIRQITLRPVD